MRVYPYWLVIFEQQIAAECCRGRDGNLREFLEKKTIFNEHPVHLVQKNENLKTDY